MLFAVKKFLPYLRQAIKKGSLPVDSVVQTLLLFIAEIEVNKALNREFIVPNYPCFPYSWVVEGKLVKVKFMIKQRIDDSSDIPVKYGLEVDISSIISDVIGMLQIPANSDWSLVAKGWGIVTPPYYTVEQGEATSTFRITFSEIPERTFLKLYSGITTPWPLAVKRNVKS